MGTASTLCVLFLIAAIATAQSRGPFITPQPVSEFLVGIASFFPTALAISPDDRFLFTASSTSLFVYDWETGRQLNNVSFGMTVSVQPTPLTHQVPGGAGLVYVTLGQYVHAYTADAQLRLVWTYQTFVPLTGVLYANETTLAIATTDGHITSLDAGTGASNWIFSANYAFQQPPGPAVGYGGVFFVDNNVIIALNESSGAPLWNASVPGEQINTAPVLNEAMDGLVCASIGTVAAGAETFSVTCYFASTGAQAWTQPIYLYGYNLMQLFSAGPTLIINDGYAHALNASYGGLVYWISNVSSAPAPSSDNRWILSTGGNPYNGQGYLLDGTELGSGYFDFAVTIPDTSMGCNPTAFVTQRRSLTPGGNLWTYVVCNIPGQLSPPPMASAYLAGFSLPVPQALEMRECVDRKCSQGCVNVHYQQRCTAADWTQPATNTKVWNLRTCGYNNSAVNILQVEGQSCAGTVTSRTTQFTRQCVINENWYHSSELLKCYAA